MKFELHPQFKKAYKNRIAKNKKLQLQTAERLRLFQKNSQNPILKDHPLKGSKYQYRSFSVTGDIRIIYKITNGKVLLYDIGSHNQVY